MELALYHPDHGFYASGGQAGRRGDFITSPEVGPLFGHLVANALDAEWDRLGQPVVFTVVEYGAGPGTLARSIAAAAPRCRASMRYVAIEISDDQRSQHPDWVLSTSALPPEVVADGLTGVVLANELLDNLAFSPMARFDDALCRFAVDVVVGEGKDALQLVPGSAISLDQVGWFDDRVDRGVLQPEAVSWLERCVEQVVAGRVVVLDYARLESDEVEIRSYADHGHAGDPLVQLGTKDITTDVDLAQLQRAVTPATSIETQAEWLGSLGIDALVEEGRALWEAGASTGSLEALKGRSRIREAEALTDPAGLGGFRVAQWVC